MSQAKSQDSKKKYLFWTVPCLIMVVVIIGLILWHMHKNAWGKITFKTFAPHYLPDNIKVTKAYADAWYIPTGRPTHRTALRLELSSQAFIIEEKGSDAEFGCQQPMKGMICNKEQSAAGQSYLQTITTIPAQPTEQTITWMRDGTRMQVTFENTKPYDTAVIGHIVDAFVSDAYLDIPVQYHDKSTI